MISGLSGSIENFDSAFVLGEKHVLRRYKQCCQPLLDPQGGGI